MENLQTAIATVYLLTGYVQGDNPTRDSYIETSLGLFSGLKGQVTHYRPWYVAAMLLSQDIDQQTIKRYDVTEFTNLQDLIQSLFALQYQYDRTYQLEIVNSQLMGDPIVSIFTV